MLPNTYQGKTAEELFPAFKPNAVSSERILIDAFISLSLIRFFNLIKFSVLENRIICQKYGLIFVD